MTSPLIRSIEKITGVTLSPTFGLGYDPALSVMANHEGKPHRYLLNEQGELIGLNLGGAIITGAMWQQILTLPDFKPDKLQALNMRECVLSTSPVTPEMKALRHLDLSGNEIEEFRAPREMALEHILLGGNDWTSPPQEIVQQGKYALLNYFRALSIEPVRTLREAKMLLLGDPGAGKTTLARKLQDIRAPLPGKEESTRGIAIETLLIGKGEDQFTARIWDFGGQQIYQGTHRFFLTKRSLWVILADNRKQNDINYWLQMAELYGDDSPLYIVVNQSDDRPVSINTTGMRDRFTFLKDTLSANLDTLGEVTRENPQVAREKNTKETARITALLQDQIQKLEHIGIEWPKSWTDIRSELERLTIQDKKDYISSEQYYEVCKANGLQEENGRLLLSAFLHDLGIILYFQNTPALSETVILNMEWATQAVFAVYDSFAAKRGQNQGFFSKKDVYKIWEGERFGRKRDQLLELMKLFKLCYQVKESDVFVMPELLPSEQPDYASLIPELGQDGFKQAPAVRYSYDFMPRGIFSRFAVEMHRRIALNQQLIWKEGAVLEYAGSYALVTETYGNREIIVKATGPFRQELMTIATHCLDEIHGTFPKLKVDKLVPCNCSACQKGPKRNYYSHESLMDRLKRKKVAKGEKITIECSISFDNVPVSALLATLFSPEENRGGFFSKNRESTSSQEAPLRIFISYSKDDKEHLTRLNKHLTPLLRANKIEPWYDEKLVAGSLWDEEIKQQLHEADIVLFLVSANFLATDYIWDEEMLPTLKNRENGLVTAIPVILSPCDWLSTALKDLSALPTKGKPVSEFSNPDVAYLEITQGIKTIIESLK